MKQLLLTTTAIALMSLTAQAHTLENGRFEGAALWKSESIKDGKYTTTTEITPKTISSEYVFGAGEKKTWSFDLQDSANGLFQVMLKGKKVGEGYCVDKAVVCHYKVDIKDLNLEETLVQQGGEMYRYGSKKEGKNTIVWQEKLKKAMVK